MDDDGTVSRAVPQPTPETAHFWEGTRVGELRYQRCGSCGHAYLPPQPLCPACGSADVTVEISAGAGTVLSAIVSHLKAPGVEPPFVLAVVELDEGARLLTNVVEVDARLDAVPPGRRVRVVYESIGEQTLPLFAPAEVGL